MMVVLPFLLVLVAAVVAIPLIAVARRRQEPGTNSPVLVITYLILVIVSFLATSSFSSLVESILPGEVTIFEDVGNLALTLSSLIVAGLVWGSVWLALEKRRLGSSTGRSLYLGLTASIAMTVVAYDTVRLLGTGLGVDDHLGDRLHVTGVLGDQRDHAGQHEQDERQREARPVDDDHPVGQRADRQTDPVGRLDPRPADPVVLDGLGRTAQDRGDRPEDRVEEPREQIAEDQREKDGDPRPEPGQQTLRRP